MSAEDLVANDDSRVAGSDPATGARLSSLLSRVADLELHDWPAAIELLTAACRADSSGELELALAELRYRSGLRLLAECGPSASLAPGTSPTVGERGVPELPLDAVDAPTVRAAILEHGCLLVPGALDAVRAPQIAAAIDHSFSVSETVADDGCELDSRWWRPLPVSDAEKALLGRKWVKGAGGLLFADCPKLQFEILELYGELGLGHMVREYLGGRAVLSANKCTLRRVPVDAVGGWHQDGAFLGSGIRAINLWLALTDCGADAPGLELIPRRFDSVVETGTGDSYFEWASGEDAVRNAAGRTEPISPAFSAGDLLIFDDLLLHRTAVNATMTRERHAIEMWCFAADRYPSGQVPVVW